MFYIYYYRYCVCLKCFIYFFFVQIHNSQQLFVTIYNTLYYSVFLQSMLNFHHMCVILFKKNTVSHMFWINTQFSLAVNILRSGEYIYSITLYTTVLRFIFSIFFCFTQNQEKIINHVNYVCAVWLKSKKKEKRKYETEHERKIKW